MRLIQRRGSRAAVCVLASGLGLRPLLLMTEIRYPSRGADSGRPKDGRKIVGDGSAFRDRNLSLSRTVARSTLKLAQRRICRQGSGRRLPTDSSRPECANSGHSPTAWRTSQIGVDPVWWTPLKLIFEVSDAPLPNRLSNMRRNGVHDVMTTCEICGHKADVNVDALPETIVVPETGRRLRCSQCGGKRIDTRPAWHTARQYSASPHR
jgi:hypothetical protein